EVLDVSSEKSGIERNHGGGNSEIGGVDTTVPRQPLTPELSRDLRDTLIHRMPRERAEQRTGGHLLRSAHASENLQPGHLARMQRAGLTCITENRGSRKLSSEHIDEN